MLFASANFVSPIVGSYLYTQYGMRSTCDIIAAVNVAFATIILIFNCGLFVFSEDRKFRGKLGKLKKNCMYQEIIKTDFEVDIKLQNSFH